MKIQSGRTLDRLCCEQACLGAVFTTYGFDPAFFEDQILRAVLRLSSDPVEQLQRYYAEALRALQETPTSVIVDAGQRRPGRRLPYDVLEVRDVVFHSKSVLLLFENHAVLMIGSGNLTSPGYSENTELFLTLELQYADEHDASLLREFDQYLVRTSLLVRQLGSQLLLVREELQRRIGNTKLPSGPGSYSLMDSMSGPFVERVLTLLPADAVIDRIEMLAPFYERDDEGDLDASSVFGAMKSRAAKDVSLDVAVAWDNAQVRRESGQDTLSNGMNHLWAWSTGDGANLKVKYLVPTAITASKMQYLDDCGDSRRCRLPEAIAAVESGKLWLLPKPQVFAPQRALKTATGAYSKVRLWLHPATQLNSGIPVHRPLHAKLLLIGYGDEKAARTLVVMGSANMSRRALLQRAGDGGNVELGIAFLINAKVTLTDFMPELVSVPVSLLDLKERQFPALGKNWAVAIDNAVFDPSSKTLVISWSEHASELPAWSLVYQDHELAAADGPPVSPVKINDFVLQAATAEVVFRVAELDFSIPILVTDLVALPIVTGGNSIGLKDLLLLLGRRMGREQAIIRAEHHVKGAASDLDVYFGTSFTPTDVFRAWWSVASDLQDESLSVMAFRLHLEGSLGAGFAWKCMLDQAKANAIDTTEVWFYGSELIRELDQVLLPDAPDCEAKRKLLDGFKQRVNSELEEIAPMDAKIKWVKTIRNFYLGEKR